MNSILYLGALIAISLTIRWAILADRRPDEDGDAASQTAKTRKRKHRSGAEREADGVLPSVERSDGRNE